MEYDERETKMSKFIKNREALGNLYTMCISYALDHSGEGWIEWMNAGDEFAKIFYDYSHGVKIKQEILTKLYNIKLPNNIIVANRLLKLIKLENER